jgi:hypothetical protein
VRRILILLVLGAVVAGCTPDSGTLEEGARQDELAPALLDEEAVRAAAGAPGGLEEVPPERANLSEDPDPRGPCGAEVDALPILDGALAVFGRDDIVIVNVVLTETDGLADRLVTATAEDLNPGCPSFTKEDTPFEEPQVTELLAAVDLGGVGDQAVAFRSTGTVGDNAPVYGVESLVRLGDDLTAIVILSSDPVAEEFVVDLTRAAATALEAYRRG